MSCCCAESSTQSRRRPIASFVQWALPITTLILVPKCPACLAAYVLLFTGIGLSFTVAALARWALIALSILALTYLLIRATKRLLQHRHRTNPQPISTNAGCPMPNADLPVLSSPE